MPSNSLYIPPFDGSAYIPLTQKGVANGVATLDMSGLIPIEQLPFASPLVYEGNWDASTNTPTLSAGTGMTGSMYIVSVAGTQSIGEGSKAYEVGDVIVADENGDWIEIGSVGGTHINGTGYIKAAGTAISYITAIPDGDIASATTWNAKQAALSGTGIVKSTAGTISYINGTSSQFVKADGSLDSTTYLTNSIFSTANTWTAAQRGAFTTLSYSATTTIDMAVGNNFRIQLTGNVTFGVPNNIVAGQSGVINIWQDSTGSRTAAWAWLFVFAGGTAPTLSTGKGVMDQVTYMVNRYDTGSVSFTNASPTVATWTSNNLFYGQEVQFTGGSLPTGVSANTSYWINPTGANTFNISTSLSNLQAGTYVNTSSTGSGTGTAGSISITANLNMQ